ncbi:pyridoxamine 5'-phosphate oxidase family protein [Pelomonas sp. KK5]|uniref:pyridoxamine 5'-phosphate oxidase family protein n=1 Tax=Pelomonas sp. KK5 TaxID=1855730 RepID=UPI0009F8B33F|nr:pyridoxamine 5'-phosphate oxidase family protein [Pelomonas sp. KK5]
METDDNKDSRETLWKLIKGTRMCMFVTLHENGHLHARPMTTQNKAIDEDDSLWFFASRRGDSVADFALRPEVNLSYANPDDDCYVSVSGRASVVVDPAKVDALWNKLAAAWFPGGQTDPDLVLVRVRITHAHYWDVKESKLRQLYEMGKAAMTGKPPTKLGESGEVRMR